ncbi:MAG: lipocalin-like domain-containing protein [Caulobacteraceae bacterium]|nr:lipocalin-like domain-containing protein [Caulobacteraceae bacterium]
MLRRSLWAVPAALALAGSAWARPRRRPKDAAPAPAPAPPPQAGSALLGAWTLVSAETLRESGPSTPAFGARISGLLVYDRSGQMSLQIAGERPSVGDVETYQAMSAEDRVVFLDTYYAYFGLFEVDEAAHVVTHRVRGSLRPNELGVNYRRQFGIDGDRLTLASPPEAHAGEVLSSRLIFVRVHPPA